MCSLNTGRHSCRQSFPEVLAWHTQHSATATTTPILWGNWLVLRWRHSGKQASTAGLPNLSNRISQPLQQDFPTSPTGFPKQLSISVTKRMFIHRVHHLHAQIQSFAPKHLYWNFTLITVLSAVRASLHVLKHSLKLYPCQMTQNYRHSEAHCNTHLSS